MLYLQKKNQQMNKINSFATMTAIMVRQFKKCMPTGDIGYANLT
jgi:hypothetical protein